MTLAVSNIAWTPDEDDTAAAVLQEFGVRCIEVAPTVRWPAPLEVSEAEALAYRAQWHARGIEIVALQSLLFGRPDLTVFGSDDTRAAMVDYLAGICRLASWLGATRLVFGSPANRRPGLLDDAERDRMATAFFRAVGARAAAHGTVVCIEPNPAEDGCEWIRSVRDAAALVEAVDHPASASISTPAACCCTATGWTTSSPRWRIPASATCTPAIRCWRRSAPATKAPPGGTRRWRVCSRRPATAAT